MQTTHRELAGMVLAKLILGTHLLKICKKEYGFASSLYHFIIRSFRPSPACAERVRNEEPFGVSP
jgi:hypothetical protein